MANKVDKRIIVIVGVTGCGKSTVGNKILKEDCFTIAHGFQPGTKDIVSKKRSINIAREIMEVTVIDTIGLSDAHSSSIRSLKELKEKLKEIEGINLLLFVIKKGRLTEAEENAFKLINEKLKESIKFFSAIIITGCEYLDEKGRNDVIEDLKNDKVMGKFASDMKFGVHVVGFPDIKTLPEQIWPLMNEIEEKDRKALHQIVHKAHTYYSHDEVFTLTCIEALYKLWNDFKALFTRR